MPKMSTAWTHLEVENSRNGEVFDSAEAELQRATTETTEETCMMVCVCYCVVKKIAINVRVPRSRKVCVLE